MPPGGVHMDSLALMAKNLGIHKIGNAYEVGYEAAARPLVKVLRSAKLVERIRQPSPRCDPT
jgi:hypothetical protein